MKDRFIKYHHMDYTQSYEKSGFMIICDIHYKTKIDMFRMNIMILKCFGE